MELDKYHIKKLLGYIEDGMMRGSACIMAGFTKSAFNKWYKEGEEHARQDLDTLQRQLYENIPVAEARCEMKHLHKITRAAEKNWRASAWYLERTRPALYAKRDPPPPERERAKIMLIG